MFALGAQGVQRGASDYRTPLVILLTANAVNAVLEVLFVYGFELGRAGLGVVDRHRPGRRRRGVRRRRAPAPRRARPQRRPSRAGMAPLMSAGRHLLLRVGSMLAVTIGATAIAARTDEATLAAHQIGAGLLLFLALALDALAIPAQTLVAEELGQGVRAARQTIARRCVRLSVIVGVAPRASCSPRLARSCPTPSPTTPPCSSGPRPSCCGSPRCRARRPSPSPTTAC